MAAHKSLEINRKKKGKKRMEYMDFCIYDLSFEKQHAKMKLDSLLKCLTRCVYDEDHMSALRIKNTT